MSIRMASILSSILSILLLLIFAVLTVIFEMIALNGASESQGSRAIGLSLACLGAGAILLGILAWKATAYLIQKFSLHPVLAVTLTTTLALLAGGTIAILTIFIAIPLAGIH